MDGLGVPAGLLRKGMAVMVAYRVAGIDGQAALICYATVMGPADEGRWWLEVFTAPGISLPQKFREDEILGVPALGLAPADVTTSAGSRP